MSDTRDEIVQHLESSACDRSLFYKRGFVNCRGKTTDSKAYYTKAIAEWRLEHPELFESIKTITRQSSYMGKGHDGISEHPGSNRAEEWIAMTMKRQGVLPIVGKALNY